MKLERIIDLDGSEIFEGLTRDFEPENLMPMDVFTDTIPDDTESMHGYEGALQSKVTMEA